MLFQGKELLSSLYKQRSALDLAWEEAERILEHRRVMSGLIDRIHGVINWLTVAADQTVRNTNKIGLDLNATETLRQEHEILQVEFRVSQ